jgi:hypothetical protein
MYGRLHITNAARLSSSGLQEDVDDDKGEVRIGAWPATAAFTLSRDYPRPTRVQKPKEIRWHICRLASRAGPTATLPQTVRNRFYDCRGACTCMLGARIASAHTAIRTTVPRGPRRRARAHSLSSRTVLRPSREGVPKRLMGHAGKFRVMF